MHLKNRWNKRAKAQSLEEIAAALSFICWKIATEGVLGLENEGFTTASNYHRLQIVGEFLAFLLQIADRLCYDILTEAERQRFVSALALKMADTFADNQHELADETKDYRTIFIELLNQRASDYAEFGFADGKPHFDLLRYFGEQVAAVMAGERWVSEYIVDVKALEAVNDLRKSLNNLLAGKTDS